MHKAEEGGYWAEIPALPGCATQGETFEDLLKNLYEAIEGYMEARAESQGKVLPKEAKIIEIAVRDRFPVKTSAKYFERRDGK